MPDTTESAERRKEIVEHRKRGMSYKAIGDLFGVTTARAHQVVKTECPDLIGTPTNRVWIRAGANISADEIAKMGTDTFLGFRAAREKLGYSPGELGEIMHIDERTIRRFEGDPALKSSWPVRPDAALLLDWMVTKRKPSAKRLLAVLSGSTGVLVRWWVTGKPPGKK